jgi:DNA-binding SARP family transcriptional activator
MTSAEFHVLGDLSVTTGGECRPITAAKQRAALAVLLLNANRAVSPAALIECIWGAELPRHPDTALHIVVSRLRGSLGPAAQRLVSGPAGYRIEVSAHELDLMLAQADFAEGQRRLRENDPNRAANRLDEALRRWKAEPLLDLVSFPFCQVAQQRLHELRVSIYEVRNDALLEAGRHIEVLETIEEWISTEPWRERLTAQYVLALYRSGRQVDALRAHDSYRDRLVEELGVEPSVELRELNRDVLSHAPKLAIGVGPLGSRIPLWTSMLLPFVGRGDEEELIFGRIREVFAGSRKMVLVEGEAGIGKTRLILEIARRVEGDAIIVAATANDSMQEAVVGLAEALVATVLQLPDDEMRRCLGRRASDLAAAVPALRDRLSDLAPPDEGDDRGRAQRLISAVASCAAALSRRAPLVILLDDLHRSGASLLILLGRLMVVDEEQRILVLATARSPASDRSSNLADLSQQLERRGRLERIQIGGLRAASVERLLHRLGICASAENGRLLHQVTDGHPFFLGEILQIDDWQCALVDPPPSVREFVRRRVHALGDADAGMLLDAAGLGIAFDAALLAEITGVARSTTAASIDRAVAAGVLRTVGKGTFTFAHELCRRALIDGLDDERRARLQYRIALALEARDLPPGVLALHWRLVPGPEAVERTLRYTRGVADAARLDIDLSVADAARLDIDLSVADAARLDIDLSAADARGVSKRLEV